MRRSWTIGIALAALAAGGAAAKDADRMAASDLQWREMFPGVTFAPAYGDWEKGSHAKFVRIAKGAVVPLHTHSNGYHAVVISGRMANLFEGGARQEVAAGDYFRMDAKRPHAHDCLTEEPCFFYTYGDGLWDIAVHQGK